MIIWIASYPKSGILGLDLLSSYYYSKNGIFDIKDLSKIEDYPNKQFFKDEVQEGEIHKHWEDSQKQICEKNKIFKNT